LTKPRHTEKPTVTAVLTAFNRRSNLDRQIKAIQHQSHKVEKIFVWVNGSGDPLSRFAQENAMICESNFNFGVWARFAHALNADTEFVWIVDDDTIPGPGWLESALATFAESPGVIGSRGLRFHSKRSYLLYDEVGPNNPNLGTERVDIVGHNWIFPTEWLSVFFQEFPNRFPNKLAGEDIHLSYAVQKHLQLGTYVPPHHPENRDSWGELEELSLFSGTDVHAISKDLSSLRKFENAYAHYVKRGFRPLAEAGYIEELKGSIISRWPRFILRLAKALKLSKTP